MSRYAAWRLAQAVPLLLLISLIAFLLIQTTGDPLAAYTGEASLSGADIERLRRAYGLDQPYAVRYGIWLANGLRGNWGTSMVNQRPVAELFVLSLPNTLILVGASYAIILVVSIPLGVLSAVKRGSAIDHLVTAVASLGIAVPSFWLGLMFLIVFAVNARTWGLPYFPAGGMFDLDVGPTPLQVAWHLVLPALTVATVSTATYVRYLRAAMLEVLGQDFVRTARAKGLGERSVLMRHAFKNAAPSLVTLMGLDLPRLLSGSLVAESIFAWPGLGRLFWEHAATTDIPVLMATMLFASALVVLGSLFADLGYALLDPRIRYGSR